MEAGHKTKRTSNRGRLNGKGMIVTGGASPFGLLIAQTLVQEGASVLLSCFSEQPQPFFVDPGGQDMPAQVTWVSGDPRDPAYCLSIVRYAYQRFGRVDGLINNSEFEFQTVWGPGARRVLPGLAFFQSANVIENFNRAITGVMLPGSGIIHTLASDYPVRMTNHPPIEAAPADARPERVYLGHGIRVMVTRPGTAWASGFFEGCPLASLQEKASLHEKGAEITQLTQSYIAFLAED